MGQKPGVSVILPVYNAEDFLKDAVESILTQSYPDFELIAIDDRSTDDSLGILRSFDDPRLAVLQNPVNQGVAKTLNRGLTAAQGAFVARMDADDISLPHRLADQMAFMASHPSVAVCGTWVEVFGRAVPVLENNVLKDPGGPEEIRSSFLFNCVLKHPSVMMRREVLDRERYRYDEAVDRAEDYALWVRIAKKYDLANLERVCLRYRLHTRKVSLTHKARNFEQADLIRRGLLEEMGLSPTEDELALHHEISRRFRTEFPQERLEEAGRWLKKIERQNDRSKTYEPEILRRVLSRRMAHITRVSQPGWEDSA